MVMTQTQAKPIHNLGPKAHAETPHVNIEVPDFPDEFKKRWKITKNLALLSMAEASEATKGGILLPGQSREAAEYAMQVGRIEMVGPLFYHPSRWKDAADSAPQIGEYVLVDPYVGRDVVVEGDKYRIIEDSHISVSGLLPTDEISIYT